MIALSKTVIPNAIENTRLLANGETVIVGKHQYIVTSHDTGWYLDGRIDHVSNAEPFYELHVTTSGWCKEHKINPVSTGGTFPWMTQEDITKAVRLLQYELSVQNKKAAL